MATPRAIEPGERLFRAARKRFAKDIALGPRLSSGAFLHGNILPQLRSRCTPFSPAVETFCSTSFLSLTHPHSRANVLFTTCLTRFLRPEISTLVRVGPG